MTRPSGSRRTRRLPVCTLLLVLAAWGAPHAHAVQPTLAASPSGALAVRADGTVVTWGPSTPFPVWVSGLSDVIAVAQGFGSSYALRSDGTVWAWGSNGYGELGDGTVKDRPTPGPVTGLSDVVAIAALATDSRSNSAYALRADGTLWAWGANDQAQLGDGTRSRQLLPVKVRGLTDVAAIAAGGDFSGYALTTDGTVFVWGHGMGSGSKGPFLQPIPLTGLPQVATIAAALDSFYAVGADGSLWTCQADAFNETRELPFRVEGVEGVAAVAASRIHVAVVLSDGTTWTWGSNDNGQLGDESTYERSDPGPVPGLSPATSVAVHGDTTLVLAEDGGVWRLGGASGAYPTEILDQSLFPRRVPWVPAVKAVAGSYHTLAVDGGGTVWAWGNNEDGQLGKGFSGHGTNSVPVPVAGLPKVGAVAAGADFSLALGEDGRIWAWGANRTGQLGDGTLEPRLSPVLVRGLPSVAALRAGQAHSLALAEDGKVWAWGANEGGQLGDGSLVPSLVPIEVQGLPTAVAIEVAGSTSWALAADGGVWYWGGSVRFPQQIPSRVVTLPGVTAGAGTGTGGGIALLKADNTVWVWGSLPSFESGAVLYDEPTWLPQLDGSAAVAAGPGDIFTLGSDGTEWAFGMNSCGELGTGTLTVGGPPRPVADLTDVELISAGQCFSLAVRKDGSLWAWGGNDKGQLGGAVPKTDHVPVPLPVVAQPTGEVLNLYEPAEAVRQVVAKPVIVPPGGGLMEPQDVTIETETPGASILYTLDGSEPTPGHGELLSKGETLRVGDGETAVLRATAYLEGWVDSPGAAAAYRLLPTAEPPTFDTPPGTYHEPQAVRIVTEADEDMVIRYTTDGSVPSLSQGIEGRSGEVIDVSVSRTFNAIAYKPGLRRPSAAVTASYTLQAEAPSFSPEAGTYESAQTVTISTPTKEARLLYTTDGSDPVVGGTPLPAGASVPVSASTTLRAVAAPLGWTPSPVTEASYTLVVPKPEVTPPAGTYFSAQTVRATSPLADVSIRYTVDGSTPSPTNGVLLPPDGNILVSAPTTLRTVGYKDGWTESATATAVYTIQVSPVVFRPPGGTFTSHQTVGITTATPGASIRYTTDGTHPTRARGTLLAPGETLHVERTLKITAIAYWNDWADSQVEEATFVIEDEGAGGAGGGGCFLSALPPGRSGWKGYVAVAAALCLLAARRRSGAASR